MDQRMILPGFQDSRHTADYLQHLFLKQTAGENSVYKLSMAPVEPRHQQGAELLLRLSSFPLVGIFLFIYFLPA